ncbi:MAG TPA: hypothetical protein VFC44_17215 [Candidatus Saccharimonadales bacterium]|nr:hypothetical protein [Candidatus Saccharimonadales bacterium]
MSNALKIVVLAVCLNLVLVEPLLAGPPFVTDDPEPVDYEHWEFYVASMHSKYGGDWSGTAPHFEVNYGAIPDLQLHLIAPLAYDSPPEGAGHYGFGDLELGAKYRFIQETNGWPQVGLFPLLEVPTGSAENNLGNGHLQAFLPVWVQKSWGSWTAYGGGGYGINSFSGHDNWNFVGGVLQKQVLTNLLIGVEVYHQSVYQTDFPNVGTAFNIGTMFDFNDHHHLLFSVGRSIDGPIGFQCYIAWQFTFDNSLLHFWSKGHPNGGP